MVLNRYRSAPYPSERKRFLAYLDDNGYSLSRLSSINRLLLEIAQRVSRDQDVTFSEGNLSACAKTWIRGVPDRGSSKKTLHASEMNFLFVARRWMQFLGRWVVNESQQTCATELDAFLWHLKDERGLADATIENRRKSLTLFFNWLDGRVNSLSDVRLAEIDAYQKDCASRRWKRTTISFHVQALRSFFRYATAKGWCSDIAPDISAPRLYANEGIPEGPSWDDVRRLIDNELGDSAVQVRNRAMLLLFAVYDFRLSEVRLLNLNDLDWEKERILLRRPKVRMTHEYLLTREVGGAILRYLKEARPKSSHRVVFLSLRQPYRPLK